VTGPAARPLPLLGDIALTAVQRVDQHIDGGFSDVPVLGLAGHAQRRSGRPSHRVLIAGVLHGDRTLDDLAALQRIATSGAETTFAADIVTALDLQKVVVTSFVASEAAGRPDVVEFSLELVESPPLPPPAQVTGFGGLDEFGLGDLGFDTDVLGELTGLAEEVAGAVDGALAAVDALDALSGLASFDYAGVLEPVNAVSTTVGDVGRRLGEAAATLGELFGS
jgi:hypothetical protein